MRKILLFITLLLAQALSAQICSGDSDLFGFSGGDDCDPRSNLGCIRHYIGSKGESTYLLISVPGSGEPVDFSKNNNVRIDYDNGTFLKAKVHSAEAIKLSKPYARDKFYITLVEFPIESSELCREKRIKKIQIERDCGEIHIIPIGRSTGLNLSKEFPGHFETAKNRAIENSENRKLLADAQQMPENIQLYVEENYPNHSYSLVQLDTVRMPFRHIMLLDYSIRRGHGELANKLEEASSVGEELTHILEQGDSLVKAFDRQLTTLEKEFKFPLAANGDQDDYQRAIIELVDYEGTETITLCSRIGEVGFSTVDFWTEANNCRKEIEELQEFINWIRRQQEQPQEE